MWNLVSHIKGRTQNEFMNGALNKIFGHKKENVKGDWRKLHNVELHDIYCSLIISWLIISRKTRYVENVAGIKEKSDT
jgi:hypothetical protein